MGFLDKFKSSTPSNVSIDVKAKEEYPDLFDTNYLGVSNPVDQISTIMPSFWTTEDTKKAIMFSAIPTGAVLLGSAALCQDQKYKMFLEATRAPQWAPRTRCLYSTMDVLTVLPLGYASYLVFKHGGGFDYVDTTVALGLYGTNLVLALASVPLLKKRNLKCLVYNSALVHLTAAAFAIAFFKIDKNAAYWSIPYVLWTGFYAYLGYSASQLNKMD